ncbi:hypothetical protein C8F04DRAFT_536242 [Mycena alexandri]|uniref:Uncharacterized protein n=1 Tax=Mycena alexandri TaxID=1745969 RepID=A0AAD6SX57_9AGAR|nr:hypothetical protein C8F04DRAFT_536242 [Mycena alexandri]
MRQGQLLSQLPFVLGAWSSLTRHANLLCLQTTYSSPLNKLLKPIQTRCLLHHYDYFKPSNVLNVLKYRGPQRSPSILPSSINHQVHSSQDHTLASNGPRAPLGRLKYYLKSRDHQDSSPAAIPVRNCSLLGLQERRQN